MKLFTYFGLTVMVVALLGCPSDSKEDPKPNIGNEQFTTCQSGLITYYKTETPSRLFDVKIEYEFDKLGLIRKLQATFSGKYFSREGGKKPFIQTTNYTYSTDGFLLSQETTVQNPSELEDTWVFNDQKHEYQNGKLIKTHYLFKTAFRNDSFGVRDPYTYTYDYDNNGRLISYTEKMDEYDISRNYLYGYDSKGQLNSYKFITTGNSTSYTYIFSDGKVFERIYDRYNEKTKYFYDNEGQLIKEETQTNNGGLRRTEYLYDNKERPTSYLDLKFGPGFEWKVKPFKGHPIIPNLFGERKHNLVEVKSNGYSDSYAYQYNSSGLPIEIMKKSQGTYAEEPSKTVIEYCK